LLGLRFMRFAYRTFGHRVCHLLLYPIVAYFYATGRKARQASREYLAAVADHPEGFRALGGPPTERMVFAHLLEFAHQLLDRFSVWSGGGERIVIDQIGRENLRAAAAEGHGGILVGSHLGSFDMMRELSRRTGPTVNVLMFTRHAARINAFFEELDPESRVRVIEFDPSSVSAAFEIKRCTDRGEFVGLAADRLWHAPRERSAKVTFLGRPARLPLGPFLLQTVLGCPLLVSLCIRVGPGRYETHVEPLSVSGRVPRAERSKRAEEMAQAYARVLEVYCLKAPLQWFNFFSFWDDPEPTP
jgi:predicted LPLAT superfamily acyltransferase